MLKARTFSLIAVFGLLVSLGLLRADSVYASPIVTVFTAGVNDNFASPTEPTSPSADFVAALPLGANFNDFDATTTDRFIAHTFANLPQGI